MRRTLFIGGSRHREWLELDDRLSHVELPAVEPVRWQSDELDVGFRRDLYTLRDIVHVAEHLCVCAAGVATIYRVAVYSEVGGLFDDLLLGIVRDAADGPYVSRRQVGTPHDLDAPTWWVYPGPAGWAMPGEGVQPPFVAEGL